MKPVPLRADYWGTMARGRSPLTLLCAFAALLGLPAIAVAQDTTPPVDTTPPAPAGWLDEPYVVLLSGTDETLFDRMEWTVDAGATINPPDGDGNAVIAAEGVHTFETRAVDAEGNDSGWRADTVRIDLTAPGDTTFSGTTAWRNVPATVLVSGTDALSGVDHVEWRLDGGGDHSGPNPTSVPVAGDGEHTLQTRVLDAAGNSSPWAPHTIRVDTVLPVDETAAPAGWQTGALMVPVAGATRTPASPRCATGSTAASSRPASPRRSRRSPATASTRCTRRSPTPPAT